MADPQSAEAWMALARQHELTALAMQDSRLAASQAYFHAGLAAECGLKAYIMRKERLNGWPDRGLREELHTHNLWTLLRIAGIDLDAAGLHRPSWHVVLHWNRGESYDPRPMPRKVARAMVEAAFGEKGAVTWIRKTLA